MTEPTDVKPASEYRFFVTVALLLVVIIVTLAALWRIERGKRLDAEGQLAQFQSQFQQKQLGDILGKMMIEQVPPPPQTVQRDVLPTQNLAIDGQMRAAFLLGAAAGERMGFKSGDVIIVSQAPATMPAGKP